MPNTPDPSGAVNRWRRLGYLLPRDIRERVFEPAFADATRAWLTRQRGRGVPLGASALSTWLGCMPIAIPRLFRHKGRLTWTGRAAVFAGLVVGLLAAMARSY